MPPTDSPGFIKECYYCSVVVTCFELGRVVGMCFAAARLNGYLDIFSLEFSY